MKTFCAWIGASLLVFAIAVLTVALAAEVRAPRESVRRIRAARQDIALEAAVNRRPAPEVSSLPR